MGKRNNLSFIVLAAGKGKRMKSSYPKVLHHIFGKPMLYYILRSAYRLEPKNVFVVVGYKKNLVREYLGQDFPLAVAVDQDQQLGTAHAVKEASRFREDMGSQVMVLSGDCPLILPPTLKKLADKQVKTKSSVTILSTVLPDPAGYGRIIKDERGNVLRVVEEQDATEDQKMINQVNTSIYCFDREKLFEGVKNIGSSNSQNEYYLTDIIEKLVTEGSRVTTLKLADCVQVLGVNDRCQLSRAERIMQVRINERLMAGGVTIRNPENTYIQDTVTIEPDTIIEPYCFMGGNTKIGSECIIGPFCQIEDSIIGQKTRVNSSVILGSSIGEQNNIGPYSYIRPNTHTRSNVKIGGFCEVKKSSIEKGSKVPHLSYVGDTNIGAKVNIGASCVTVNYDGYQKHKTVIEDDVFIGSDTMLIAPVRVGRGAVVAAGSVITEDVPPHSLAIERGTQKNIDQGAIRYRKKKEKQNNRRS